MSRRNRNSSSEPAIPEFAKTTKTSLKVESAIDTRSYRKNIKVSRSEMQRLDLTADPFHPEWNYTNRPRQLTSQQPVKAQQSLSGMSLGRSIGSLQPSRKCLYAKGRTCQDRNLYLTFQRGSEMSKGGLRQNDNFAMSR